MSLVPKPNYGELFSPPAQRHSPTSIAAAESVKGDVNTLREMVLDFIAVRGTVGATDEEIADGLRMNPSTARPRRIELVEAGHVRHSGQRKGRSGRQMSVWILSGVKRGR